MANFSSIKQSKKSVIHKPKNKTGKGPNKLDDIQEKILLILSAKGEQGYYCDKLMKHPKIKLPVIKKEHYLNDLKDNKYISKDIFDYYKLTGKGNKYLIENNLI